MYTLELFFCGFPCSKICERNKRLFKSGENIKIWTFVHSVWSDSVSIEMPVWTICWLKLRHFSKASDCEKFAVNESIMKFIKNEAPREQTKIFPYIIVSDHSLSKLLISVNTNFLLRMKQRTVKENKIVKRVNWDIFYSYKLFLFIFPTRYFIRIYFWHCYLKFRRLSEQSPPSLLPPPPPLPQVTKWAISPQTILAD